MIVNKHSFISAVVSVLVMGIHNHGSGSSSSAIGLAYGYLQPMPPHQLPKKLRIIDIDALVVDQPTIDQEDPPRIPAAHVNAALQQLEEEDNEDDNEMSPSFGDYLQLLALHQQLGSKKQILLTGEDKDSSFCAQTKNKCKGVVVGTHDDTELREDPEDAAIIKPVRGELLSNGVDTTANALQGSEDNHHTSATTDFVVVPENQEIKDTGSHTNEEESSSLSVWDKLKGDLQVFSPQQIQERAVTASRPKKKVVSVHSFLATMTTGFFLNTMIPLLSPGFYDSGLPRIYDLNAFHDPLQAKILYMCFTTIAITGVLRLPPNSPKLRRYSFESLGWFTFAVYIISDSNLVLGEGTGTFDLISGNPLVWAPAMMVVFKAATQALEFLEEAIGGTSKGRETLPFGQNRLAQAMIAFVAYLAVVISPPAQLFLHDTQGLQDYVIPAFREVAGPLMILSVGSIGFTGFGALASTMFFEKKINEKQAGLLWGGSVLFTGFYDAVVTLISPLSGTAPGESVSVMNEYNMNMFQQYHLLEGFALMPALASAHGLWRLFRQKRDRAGHSP